MSVPLQVQLFDAFLGTQEGIHSIILPDIFSSGGSQNVYIDKFGRVCSILGYTKQNTAAFTTDTGASASLVRGLIPYRGTAGGTIARKLLIVLDDNTNEWEVHVSTDQGVTKTFLYDAGAGSVGMIPDACQLNDNLYLTNGKVQPRVYNGTAIAATGLTQSPTITATEAATSGNLMGNYQYKLVSTIAGVRQNGSLPSTSVLLTNKQMTLGWSQDANASVDGYEIYRTTGTGSTYYYLASIDGRAVVAYTDNISDDTLLEKRVLEEHGDAPPVAYFCEAHKQRVWWLRTDTYPTRGYWSDPSNGESVYNQSYLDFSDSETVGDQITGGLGNYEGLLVVFTEKALWTVSGTGVIIGDIVDWTKTRTNAQTGAVSSRSAIRVPAGSKYSDQTGQIQTTTVTSIGYFTPLGDIRLFDGQNDLIISHPVRDTLGTFNYAQRQKIHAVHDSQNDQIIWFFPSGVDQVEPNVGVCWNYRFGVWYKWSPQPFAASCELDTSSDPSLMLVGESLTTKGGFVYKYFTGNAFDTDVIDARWMTKALYGINEQKQPALSNRKRWRWIDLLFKVDQAIPLYLEWFPGGAIDSATAATTLSVSAATELVIDIDGSRIDISVPGFPGLSGGAISTSSASVQDLINLQNSRGDYLHDEGIRLRIKSNSSVAGWSLEAMELAYQILPGLKRRTQ